MRAEELSRARSIASRVRESFDDFVEKRMTDSPSLRERAAHDELGAIHVLRILSLVPIRYPGIKRRRYIFLSAKFEALIAGFTGEEAMIVGRPSDFKVARRLGIPFCFSGDLYAASHGVLFNRKGVPTSRIIDRWIRFLSAQRSPCFLVVANDTSPISLLLVEIARDCPNIIVVCIQHGLFNPEFMADDIEGRNSHINLVYDEGQRIEMKRRLPDSVVEVMGLPVQIQRVSQANATLHRVILVGTGNIEHPELYNRSMSAFQNVAHILGDKAYDIKYKPHPFERNLTRSAALGINYSDEPAQDLLSGEKKIFIGFNSTLLYEASQSGHTVILLDDPMLPGYRISDFGYSLATNQLEKLPSLLTEAAAVLPVNVRVDDLRIRFESSLKRASDALT